MRHPLLAPDLREIIVEGNADALREFFAAHHPAEAAELLDDLEPTEAKYVLDLLDGRHRAAIFSYLDPPLQDGIADLWERRDLAILFTNMSPDERADLATRLEPERLEQVMPLLAGAEREDIRLLTAQEEGTAGAVMTSDYATLPAESTAAAAIEKLRREAPDRETIYYCYVVDDQRRLVGFVSLKDLILAPPGKLIRNIMQTDVVNATVDEDQESAAQKLMEYDLLALPIVNAEGQLVGIVTHDDVIDVIVEEATEDVHRMGAVSPLEQGYLQTPFFTLWGNRGFWLAILFVGGFLTTWAMSSNDEVFRQHPVLLWFLPLIISAGGNCGSQSATLITRALALDELTPSDWFRVLRHEILMGLSLGAALGMVGFLRAWFVPDEVVKEIGLWRLCEIVSLGVAAVVIVGNLVGAMLPLVLRKMRLDPALMSNPVLASLVDVTGILAYVIIAGMLLPVHTGPPG